jgi:hypothetical protein
MREIRLYGSEGGGAETNRSFLPLSRGVLEASRTYRLSTEVSLERLTYWRSGL